MFRVKCLSRDSQGLCTPVELPIEREGSDWIVYNRAGAPTRMQLSDERTEAMGWGGRSGPAVVLAGDATWQVLIPEDEAKRIGLIDSGDGPESHPEGCSCGDPDCVEFQKTQEHQPV